MVYLFVSIPLDGHIKPALSVAAALNGRLAAAGSSEVRFAALSRDRARVEAAGIEFVDLGDLSPDDNLELERLKAATIGTSDAASAATFDMFTMLEAKMLPPLLKAIDTGSADVIVADFAAMAGHDAAEARRLPLVVLQQIPLGLALLCSGHNSYNLPSHVPLEMAGPLMQPERLSLLQRAVNPLLKRWVYTRIAAMTGPRRAAARKAGGLVAAQGFGDLEMMGWGAAVPRVMNLVSGVMDLEVERELPPGWHMTGPQNVAINDQTFPMPLEDGPVRDFLTQAEEADQPVVYVATGTIVRLTQGQVDAVVEAMRAVEGARFVWSLPKESQLLLSSDFHAWSQGRVLVLSWAPQQALLSSSQVELFVTHGGLNSTYEGLAAGKPLVVMPFFGDQPVNAQHIVNKGLGAQVDPWTLTAAKLTRAIEAQLADREAARRVAELGARLRRQSGAQRAAELLERFGRQ